MEKNKNILLLVVLFGAIALWFVVSNHKSTIDKQIRDFAISDTSTINKIVLQQKNTSKVILEKDATSGKWKLNGVNKVYMPVLVRLFYTLHKVDIKNPVSKKQTETILHALNEKGIRCDVYQNNKLTKSYYIGEATEDFMGTYMVLINPETSQTYDQPFVTYVPGYNSYLSPHYLADANYWRDKTVFNYDEKEIASITVETPLHPEKDYELSIGSEGYQIHLIAKNKPLSNIDSLAVKQYLTYFFQLYFERLDNSISAEELDRQVPLTIVTVKETSGKQNKVAFYLSDEKGKEDGEVNNTPLYIKALLNNNEVALLKLHLAGKLFQNADYFKNTK